MSEPIYPPAGSEEWVCPGCGDLWLRVIGQPGECWTCGDCVGCGRVIDACMCDESGQHSGEYASIESIRAALLVDGFDRTRTADLFAEALALPQHPPQPLDRVQEPARHADREHGGDEG